MTKIYALGGSVITKNLEKLSKIAKSLKNQEEQVGIVTGAGNLKKYIEASDTNQYEKDSIGIYATRLHAKTLQTMIPNSYADVPENMKDLEKAAKSGKNFVTGGITPGYSTDAVAAICAELTDAKLYIASTVDGIYEEDPEISDSVRFKQVEINKIRDILQSSNKAGNHSLIDRTALRIIERSNIETKVMEGTAENIEDPDSAEGTKISL